MTEPISVHLYFLLDRTGSMGQIRSDVIGGFNAFLTEQQAMSGDCLMTLVQFDSQNPFEVIHDAVPIANVAELTEETFVPRSGTPLLDAEGMLMVRAEERVAQRAKEGQPAEAIVFATYTDGEENASREWTFDAVRKCKDGHEDWAFYYLGVGHDAYKQARFVGTYGVNTMAAPADTAGVGGTMGYLGQEIGYVRGQAAAGSRTGSAETRSALIERAKREGRDPNHYLNEQ